MDNLTSVVIPLVAMVAGFVVQSLFLGRAWGRFEQRLAALEQERERERQDRLDSTRILEGKIDRVGEQFDRTIRAVVLVLLEASEGGRPSATQVLELLDRKR